MGSSKDLTHEIQEAVNQLTASQEILIVTHNRPTFDSVGSSLGLMLALQSLGKKTTLACSEPMTVAFSNFIGVNKIVSKIGKRNFVVSLDYTEGSIEKVSYNIEGAKFNLVIEPRVGFPAFNQENVNYSYSGVSCDAIVAVDTIHFGGFHDLYEENKELFSTKPVIVIDRHPNNALYGTVNLVDGEVATTTELVAKVISGLDAQMTADIASNLLNGLFGGSDNFTSTLVGTETFNLAAYLVSAGGRHFTTAITSEELPDIEATQTLNPEERATDLTPLPQVAPFVKPAEGKTIPTPAEWLKPKIFKSSHLL